MNFLYICQDWTIRMATITENDNDAGSDSGTQYTISLGDSFQGTLADTDDGDWVKVELDSDTIYDISPTDGDDLRLSLLDLEGNYVVSGHANYPGDKLIISPDESGIYYIGITNRGTEAAGDYTISLTENTIPIGTYDELADYLIDGWWETVNLEPHKVDVETGGILTVSITALNEDGQQLARWALEAWTMVTGIEFEFVEDDSAFITFDDSGENSGHATTEIENGIITSALVVISADTLLESGTTIGSWSFYSYIHEIGHALGLGHLKPDAYSPAFGVEERFLLNSFQASTLSGYDQARNTYINASSAHPVTPMIADIIAVQKLYGLPVESNGGDTVYGYQSNVAGYLGEFFRLWTGEADPFILTEVPDDAISAYHAQAFADLDGDGDPDMVIGNHQGDFHYFENTSNEGNPGFTLRTGESNPLDSLVANLDSTPVFADLDSDGDLDLVNGHSDGIISYIENTGTATAPDFTQRSGEDNPFDDIDTGYNSTPELADLDSDGDLDLIAGNINGALAWFENTSTASAPAFTQRTGTDNPLDGVSTNANSAPELADLDSDGDLDLVLWGWYGAIDYYENTGSAANPAFEKRSDADDPLGGINFNNLGKPSLVDLDGDGDLDLAVRDSRGTDFKYFENDGTEAAPEFIRQQLSQPAALTLYDTGGTDTLDLRTDRENQRIDLRPEGISDVYGLTGNLVIARDVMIENAIAGFGNDVVIGNSAENRLEGRTGDDVLEGGAGADTLDGGAGSDTAAYTDSDTGVTVRLLTGAGRRGHAEGDTLSGIENLTGSAHNDAFGGDTGNNVLNGGPGNDGLWGSGGDDILIGGPGADRFYGGGGQDTADYTNSPAGVTVRLHSLSASGGDAEGDTFESLIDVSYTDADGAAQTESLPDIEHLTGSAHNDILAGDRRDNVLDGAGGNDTLYGGPGGGDDAMLGNAGDDRLFGGQGADRLDGGTGDDTLSGGPAGDVFVFAPGSGDDTITDFTNSQDRIDLTAFELSGYDDLTLTDGTDGVTIDLSAHDGGTILLEGFDMADLDAADILF